MNFRTEIIYLTNFLKTSLTKFVVILVKRRQNAGFLSPRSSKIRVTKKKKGKKERGRRREKTMVALLVFIMATLEIVFGRKKELLEQKVYLAIRFRSFSKIRLQL